jgi:outer membrane immunogenic protein
MKPQLLSATAIALVLSAGSALAADLSVRKAPVYAPPPPPMWSGFYAGLNAGWAWSHKDEVTTTPIDHEGASLSQLSVASIGTGVTNLSTDGFVAGGQFGFNYQFGPNFMLGIEVDLQGTDLRSTTWLTTTTGITTDTEWLGTVRGRIGFLVNPSLLVYGTGGLAYGGVEASVFGPRTTGHFDDTLVGWTAGGGLEWLFTPNASIKGEVLYYDLGDATFATQTPLGSTVTNIQYDGFIARVGLNFHLNWGSPPVMARY